MKYIAVLLFLFCSLFSGINSQIIDLEFNLLDKEVALSNSNTTSIDQDAHGYVWIGTTEGLNRYDGYSIQSYFSISNDSLSIPDNHIRSIFCDSKGTLWIGTSTGLCSYIPENDHFKRYDLSQIIPDHETHNIAYINENHSNIYFGIWNSLIRYSYESDSLEVLLTIEEGEISSFEFDTINNIWIGGNNEGGLYKANSEGKIENRYLSNSNSLNHISANSIFDLVLYKNKLWIATEGGGINRFDPEKETFYHYPYNSDYEKYARYTYVDNDGRLWIGDHTGIKLYNDLTDQFYGYYPDPSDPNSIPANALAIFQDIQGNYWTLHHPGGAAISVVKKGFKTFDGNPYNRWYTSDDNIVSIAEDSLGNLWMSNPYNGIDIFYWTRDKIYRFLHEPGKKNSLGDGATFDLYWDDDIMWIATNRGGLQYINKNLNRFVSFVNNPADTTTIACNDIRSITSDAEGNLWLTVHGKGVDKFDRKTNRFIHYTNKNNNLSNDWTFEVLVDSNGEIWVATAWGLSRLKKGAKKFENYYHNDADANSISDNNVTTVFQDELNRIWIGTGSGLNLYNKETDNFSHIGGPLQNIHISAILDDMDHNLWVTTQDGLFSYNPSEKSFRHFDEDDGLPSTEFNPRSYYKNLHNDLFFGSTKGVIIFNPDKLKYNKKPPVIQLSNLKLFYQDVTSYGKDSILNKNISFADRVLLDYHQNMVTFEFTAINMIQAHKNQYAYKMEGFDKEWRYIGTKREATYTNLSPGTYTFRVKASNNDGYWNEEGTSIRVIINPPWWMTWWFRVLSIIAVLVLIAGFILIRYRQLIRQKAYLAKQVRLKTEELQGKNQILQEQAEYLNETNTLLEERQEEIVAQSEKLQELNSTKDKLFSIIAHDLTSPFNTILGFTELLSINFEKMNGQEKINIAAAINDSAKRVYGLLDNLLKWARSQTEGMIYNPKNIRLEEIFSETIQLYNLRMQEKNIKLVIDNENDIKVNADAEMLKSVIRNLLSNAIKFTDHGGHISISAIINSKNAVISLTDTGVGMEPERIERLFDLKTSYSTQGTDGEKGSGIGLMLARDFVEKNKGRLNIDSTPGQGTTIRFTVPLA